MLIALGSLNKALWEYKRKGKPLQPLSREKANSTEPSVTQKLGTNHISDKMYVKRVNILLYKYLGYNCVCRNTLKIYEKGNSMLFFLSIYSIYTIEIVISMLKSSTYVCIIICSPSTQVIWITIPIFSGITLAILISQAQLVQKCCSQTPDEN